MRTAQSDDLIGDTPIAKGDWLYLSYPAANIDPVGIRGSPRFDVTRSNADQHIAFGYGIHFCLGAQMARMELRSLFGHSDPETRRLSSCQVCRGQPATTFVGGHKSVPIRYTLTAE